MMHPKLAAIAVVIRDEQVLLVRRKKEPDAGLWGFPGGHVELGETALDAAVRELAEETTVIATPVSYITNIDVITYDDAGEVAFHFLLAAVLCRYESGTPTAQDDVSHAKWIDIADIHARHIETSEQVDEVIRLSRSLSYSTTPTIGPS